MTTPSNAIATALASFARLLLLALAMAAPAHAHRPDPSPALVELEIVDRDSGRRLQSWHHQGQAWVAGEPGRPYAIGLRNLTGSRVLVVLSVDGLNAIDGRSAAFGQAGYVLGPWQALEVTGWRKSLGTVARFVFDDPARSYAARTGRPANIGVIGIAVFREHAPAYLPPPIGIGSARQAHGSEPSPGRQARAIQRTTDGVHGPHRDGVHSEARAIASGAPAPGLGTGHGAVEGSRAYYTGFEREAVPSQVSEVRYDTRAGLLARGVRMPTLHRPGRHRPPLDEPRPFPGEFVPDPR